MSCHSDCVHLSDPIYILYREKPTSFVKVRNKGRKKKISGKCNPTMKGKSCKPLALYSKTEKSYVILL